MLQSLRQRTSDEGGFTLIELLVVILIIGILAAIAIPALLSQKSKAYDSSAKTLAQTAQTAMETYATENNGEYTGGTATKLNEIEPSLNTTKTQTKPSWTETDHRHAGTEYTVTAEAPNTRDQYSVDPEIKRRSGTQVRKHRSSQGCPGHTADSSSW